MTKKHHKHPFPFRDKPWENNENNIWIASTFQLMRNVDKFPFPEKLDQERREQIVSLVSRKLLEMKELKKPVLFKVEALTPFEKEFLFEHFLSRQSFSAAHAGEAFVLDETGRFFVTLNIHNHIQFEFIECGGELEAAWNTLVRFDVALGHAVNFAFSHRFGFLTANPATCGTGFILSLFLQPVALIQTGQLSSVLEKMAHDSIEVTGLGDNPEDFLGDILVLRNRYTLGVTEENILSSLRLFATRLCVEERSLRTRLTHEEAAKMKDKVSRAYGVLLHSYEIEAREALEEISLLKLGLDLGWISGTTPTLLNRLFFYCRRGHLLQHQGKETPPEALAHMRSSMIHAELKGVTLHI